MQTELLKASEESIAYAALLLRAGEAVGIPTETVYGLAADATNDAAVA
ncbi:MAG: Sua5/YciO/YrdC/YwlC family protein, partial [Pygmaiobacter sp.]